MPRHRPWARDVAASGATNPLIGEYFDEFAPVVVAPREQGTALCLRAERLLAGAHAHVADDFTRVAWGSGSSPPMGRSRHRGHVPNTRSQCQRPRRSYDKGMAQDVE